MNKTKFAMIEPGTEFMARTSEKNVYFVKLRNPLSRGQKCSDCRNPNDYNARSNYGSLVHFCSEEDVVLIKPLRPVG